MNNKYYFEIKNKLNKLIENKEYTEALKIINEELSMPYIPRDIETFLEDKLKNIPLNNKNMDFTLSLERVIDLLIKLDKSNNDVFDLINHLKKFNLANEKEELEYYFINSENKRNRAMIFDLLINEKADIECDLGKTVNSSSIEMDENYKQDKNELIIKLDKYPVLIEPSIKLLNEIYLTKHYKQKLEKEYWDVIILTLSKIFKQEELLSLINDLNITKSKLKDFKSFDLL